MKLWASKGSWSVSYLHCLKTLALFLCNIGIHLCQWNILLIKSVHETEPDWKCHGPEGTAKPGYPIPLGVAGPELLLHQSPHGTGWGREVAGERTHLWSEMADLPSFIMPLFFHQVGKSSGWGPRLLWRSWVILPRFKVNDLSWYILGHVIFLHSWPWHRWKNKIKNGTFITNTRPDSAVASPSQIFLSFLTSSSITENCACRVWKIGNHPSWLLPPPPPLSPPAPKKPQTHTQPTKKREQNKTKQNFKTEKENGFSPNRSSLHSPREALAACRSFSQQHPLLTRPLPLWLSVHCCVSQLHCRRPCKYRENFRGTWFRSFHGNNCRVTLLLQ